MSGTRSKRDRRRRALEEARETWTDEAYGISLELIRQGRGQRARLRWLIDEEPMLALMGLHALRRMLDGVERELVLAGRSDGLSWEDLGWALERTGEAVRRRHAAAEAEYLEEVNRG